MPLFGLIGYPLSHSFSKKYFTKKFEREGLTDCRFENFSFESIADFPILIERNPDLKGIAVTIPHKQSVLQFIDDVRGIPEGLTACNCISIRESKLYGFNTDYIGFEKSMVPFLKPHHQHALVLGNGGATAAIIFALKRLGISYDVVSRKPHKGSTLTYRELDADIIRKSKIIINTTPLGMYPNVDTYPDIPYEFISSDHLLYDLTYNPVKTLFLQKGDERAAVIKNGEEMLVLQAEENWRIWNS
ncbi:shikimate dehydrogenase [Chitinophagaceae bacterium IBVUCB2]|nr:shikimate dehydrogenase [Chitinophagaceae bacterium IBVUCB2]